MAELKGSAIDIVERAYDADATTSEWLDAIRFVAARSFSGHMEVQAYTFRITSEGKFLLLGLAREPSWDHGFKAFHEHARLDTLRKIYLGGPVRSVGTALKDPLSEPAYVGSVNAGIRDVWAAIGLDPSGTGFGLAFLYDRLRRHMPRPTRQALARLAAHLGTALRLRGTLDQSATNPDLLSGSEAVLAPDGAVLHAEGNAREADARSALREAARRIDRARLRSHRNDPETGLGLWRALVDGRWSLVERFESDGRRIWVARRNEPTMRPSNALTPLERKVVALAALGHSVKYSGYELGRSTSTIHEALHSAMRKLGVDSRAALIELHGRLVDIRSPSLDGTAPTRDDGAK